MTAAEAWSIVGNQPRHMIRNMQRALNIHSGMNTAEENKRLAACAICLKNPNPRYTTKGELK